MNFFSTSPRAKQAKTNSPNAAIAKRLETLEGCDAYLNELQKIKAGHAANTQITRHFNGKIELVKRAAERLRLVAERKAVSAAIAASKSAAINAIKAAENALAVADNVSANAPQACAAMEARIAPLSARVAELRQSAAQRLQAAQARFDDVMAQPSADEKAERDASQALIEAKRESAESGVAECLRLDKLALHLQTLKAAEEAANQARSEAAQGLNQALAALALVEYDDARQLMVDAYFVVVQAALPTGGKLPGHRVPDAPLVDFSQAKHATGARDALGKTINQYALDLMARNLTPINLDVLAAPLPEQIAEPAAVEGGTE